MSEQIPQDQYPYEEKVPPTISYPIQGQHDAYVPTTAVAGSNVSYQATPDVINPTGGASLVQHGPDGGWYYPSGDTPVANNFYPYPPVPPAYRHPGGYEQPGTSVVTSFHPPPGQSETVQTFENAPLAGSRPQPYGLMVNIPRAPVDDSNAFASTSSAVSPSPVSESPIDTPIEDETSQQEETIKIPEEIQYRGSGESITDSGNQGRLADNSWVSQWIRVKTTGTTTSPALAYAAAGYDALNNQLVIFGGETAGGLFDGNTHLLNLDSLTWTSPPASTPQNPALKPPARSHSSYGHDIIASYRNGLIVYGGKGQQGALSDVWEYAFNGQFWYNLTVEGDIPSPRFGAVGGGDPPSVDNSASNLLTTFWLAGGANMKNDGSYQPIEYDTIYRLQIGGTIASNYKDGKATWTRFASPSTSNVKARLAQAGMVMRTTEGDAKLGLYGGCEGSDISSVTVSCAQRDAHLLSTNDANIAWSTIPSNCPSARIGAVLVPTLNHLFADTAFLLLGLSPNSNVTDASRLDTRGEIGVLSLSQGTWTRILPSCDPLSDPPCPVPREGAAVVSSATSMVGSLGGGGVASDIFVFGGKDANGNVLNDVWILRATTAQITGTNQTDWGPLYGDSTLGSGVDTNGHGVTVEYVTDCSSAASITTTSHNSQQTGSNGSSNSPSRLNVDYTTSAAHKVLTAASLLAILVAVLLSRWSSKPGTVNTRNQARSFDANFVHLLILVASAAWAAGVAGFVTSFTSIKRNVSSNTNLRRRGGSQNPGFAATPHAIAGCILFALAYIVAPLVLLSRHRSMLAASSKRDSSRDSVDEETSAPGLVSHRSDDTWTGNSPHAEKSPTRHHATRESQEDTGIDGKVLEEEDVDPIGAGERTKLKSRSLAAPSAFLRHQLWSSKRNQPRQRVTSL
ncbi:hypothetical protein FRC17_010196, partial [Serendipita sp. 399]